MAGMSGSNILTFCLLFPALLTAGCGSTNDTIANPNAPTPVAVSEPLFTGLLSRNGAATYPFVANTGSITVTLSGVDPDTTVIGFALGTWNQSTELCQIVLANDNAIKGKVIIGTAQNSSAYCVRVFDVGKVTDPTTYEVAISHF